MVYDEPDHLRSDQEERRREKFSRERVPDYNNMDRGRRFGGPAERRDYANGIGRKRPVRDDDIGVSAKRSRFDGATDSYEPQFIRKDGGDNIGQGANQIQQLLTFKKFLATQDESLTDEQAIEKYAEYKMEFMKQECERYFQAHKEEEWFRLKYHPEESKQRTEEHRQNLQKRLEIFNELLANGPLKSLALSYENAESIIRILNEVVIKLEGGTQLDIQAANEEEIDDESVLDLLTPEQLKKKEAEKKLREAESTGDATKKPGNDTNAVRNTEVDMETNENNKQEETAVEAKPCIKRINLLHKTRSIHFRTIPADVPLADVENLCKQHPGFLRLAITDPSPDSKGKSMRSAWATYRWDVNVKDIFWALRSAKLNGVELSPSVNRDVKCRVRTIGATRGLTGHRPIVHNDIRNAAKLVVLLDLKAGFYKEEAEEGEEQGGEQNADLTDLEAVVLRSRNPLLSGIIKDYMVEESNAEEEMIQERVAAIDGSEVTQTFEVDQQMTQFLDRLLLYLRIVHSVDYYASSEYNSEDDMPHRLDVVHVRGRPPTATQNWPCTDRGIPFLSKNVVDRHIVLFNFRTENVLMKKLILTESELTKLGKKDAEKAVEDFMSANTQQLGPDKWLCPLSGKKFKGAEFVQKHLQSKFAKEIEMARHEALYFNNFLADPSRPHNPIFAKSSNQIPQMDEQREHRSPSPPPLRRTSGEESVGGRQVAEANERPAYQRGGGWSGGTGGGNRFGGGGGRPFGGGGGGGFGAPPRRPFHEPFNEMNMGGGGGMRKDPRAPPSYRDLDAPNDEPIF